MSKQNKKNITAKEMLKEIRQKESQQQQQQIGQQDVPGYDTKQVDKDHLAAHNAIRMRPKDFVPKLEAMLPKF